MNDNLPIIVGVGQTVNHWDGTSAAEAPSPLQLITEASSKAIEDTGLTGLAAHFDYLAVVRLFSDSVREQFFPFGQVDNYPQAVASQLGATPVTKIYSTAGGEQPQSLVNELAKRLYEGQSKLGLITGAEAIGALKMALKNHHRLDWSSSESRELDDRGAQTDFISQYEVANGLGMPPQTYALMETALRNRLGLGKEAYLQCISEMFANLSQVAANNPYAQFPEPRTAEFLSTPSKDNFPVCEPYLKWHVAQDSVNQGAALIMTTVGFAKKLGIAEDKWIYLHGHSEVKDKLVSERPDLSLSLALEVAISEAVNGSGIDSAKITHRDIYSCFPIVPYLAAEVLNLNPLKDSLTVTGGLPFFGGPGNNYSTHAIASMVELLRKNTGDYGLVVANGGFLSKESAGVYSAQQPPSWQPFEPAKAKMLIDKQKSVELLKEDGEAVISAYGIRYARAGVDHCYVAAENSKGRYLAKANLEHRSTMAAMAEVEELLGKKVKIASTDGENTIVNQHQIPSSDDQYFGETMTDLNLPNSYKYVQINRLGNILEVTLNRPESYNALFSEAHFELAEIFDAFEADKDLWVAIITGSGDKAFCSGNDLKVTAKGGDMSIPKSGFAGLCSRMNREKPVIAAVNGLAFGGGMEVVLAADMAVAEPHAQFALPEVKVGLFAGAGGVQRLSKQIGRKAAMELILTGRAISAEQAQEYGIINSVTEGISALDHARQIAKTIAANSPSAIRASKRVLNEVDRIDDVAETFKLSGPEFKKLLQTKDAREGVTAFAEKRKPTWLNE